MKWFEVDCKLKEEDIEWARDIGDNITEPNWTIRPYKLLSLIHISEPTRPY